MATITTTTQTNPITTASGAALARDFSSGSAGDLWAIVLTGSATLTAYRSTNDGASWTNVASFTHTGLVEWSSLVIDNGGRDAHIMYRLNAGGDDSVYYRRLDVNAGAWGGGVLMSGVFNNGGTGGSVIQGMDLAVYRRSSSTTWIVHAFGFADGSGKYGIACGAVALNTSTGGTSNASATVVVGQHYWLQSTPSGRITPSVELEHTGDGITPSSTPNIWIAFGRTKANVVKLAWNGNGWTGPASFITVKSSLSAHDYMPGRWDGSRFLIAVINPDDPTTALVLQRNQSNTTTTTLTTPAHPQGNITGLTVSYDSTSKDVRVFALGTSNAQLYSVTYSRSLGTWGSWTSVLATAVMGAEFSVRKGGTAGNAKHDVVTGHSGSPNTVVHTAQAVNTVPSNPSWETSGQPYVNGGAADVNAALTLDWTFFDADPGQTQQSYALSRQIGAGAVQYWNAGSSTWGGSEVQNNTSTTQVTLASGWGADGDANHSYRVKVWDSAGTSSAAYGPALVLIPSVKANPTITSPTASAVITVDQVAVTWTVSAQKTRRLRLLTNPGAVPVYDSGFVTTSDTSFTIPTRLENGTGWTIELTTTNAEGLPSNAVTRSFTVSYAPPPAPTSTLTPLAASGVIRVGAQQLAAVGVQPATTMLDLYRRKSPGPPLNLNHAFQDGNVVNWFVGGGGTPGTLTYSTTQQFNGFAGGPIGSARYVPPGSGGAADPGIESSTFITLTPGKRYVGAALIRPDTSNKPVEVRLILYTAADAFVAQVESSMGAVGGAWHYVEVTVDPSAWPTAAKARVTAGLGNTPTSSDGWYVAMATIREQSDDMEGVRVAVGQSPGAVVDDWGPASGVDYEYRWLATGANGTSIYGPWVR